MTNLNPTLSICVFCGSREGQSPNYRASAEEFGTWMADQGHRLVYGAGDMGLMGAVSRAFTDKGGRAMGVIPTHLLKLEDGRSDLHSYVVTENMHERKKVMFMNSDAIVVLPGGAGSLDEFFEVLTWSQLGLHNKPIYVLNTDGFWDPLNALIQHIITQGFAATSLADLFEMVPDVASLQARISEAATA